MDSYKSSEYCKQVRLTKNLWTAWRHVFRASLKSASDANREAAWEFDAKAATRLDRIQRQLTKGQFKFKPSRGIPKKRKGKNPRPIVDAPLSNKIVQRSILTVAQEIPTVKEAVKNPASFGALEGRGVRHAMEAIVGAVEDGAQFYARSDIQDFFSNIPKAYVRSALNELVADLDFVELFMQALEVELENLQELGANKEFFPLHEIGIAQGCCLSPFVGNLLLREFDRKMNCRGISCFRYVDDFVIIGPDQKKVKKAFSSARNSLNSIGLQVYDPYIESEKAKSGPIQTGFEFLGCNIKPGMISPSKKARLGILRKVIAIRQESERAMSDPSANSGYRLALSHCLARISNTIRGWGNQYAFCNDGIALEQLDQKINTEIDKLLRKFRKKYKLARANNDSETLRRLLGVHLLVDCNRDPII